MNAMLQRPQPAALAGSEAPRRFELIEAHHAGGSTWMTTATSVLVHGGLVALILIVPLLSEDVPATTDSIRAFFVTPDMVTPPPPPPPPPAASVVTHRVAPQPPSTPKDTTFRAPLEVPATLAPEEPAPDLGVEGGMAGGVEGGMAGGVVGGVVGGLVTLPTPGPVIRIGGNVRAPKLLRRVDPVYPTIARNARVSGLVVLEATVDEKGFVREVHVVQGIPLLDAAALEAIRQWRYQPLLLNGIPFDFSLTITVRFGLSAGPA